MIVDTLVFPVYNNVSMVANKQKWMTESFLTDDEKARCKLKNGKGNPSDVQARYQIDKIRRAGIK